jgi:hypothetical protein
MASVRNINKFNINMSWYAIVVAHFCEQVTGPHRLG